MFDAVLMVDWSGGNDRGASPKKDAIWACRATPDATDPPVYLRNRQVAEEWIMAMLDRDLAAGRRICAGFDFPLACPQGFARELTGQDDPRGLWDWFHDRVRDSPKSNNRFDLGGEINARFPGIGPYWGNGLPREIPDLPRKGNARTFRWPHPRRPTEAAAKGSFEVWQLSGAGAVGGQAIMGMPVLARLVRKFGDRVSVWPFDPPDRPLTLMEIWPSLIAPAIASASNPGEIRDAAQMRVMAGLIARLPSDLCARLLACPAVTPEGWIFGVGHENELTKAARRPQPDA